MALTRTEVDHIAELARLGLTEEEKARLARQLSAILDHFQVLQTLDTATCRPPLRQFRCRMSWPKTLWRSVHGPGRHPGSTPRIGADEFFRVRAILD